MFTKNKSYKMGELICSEIPMAYALHNKVSSQYCAECLGAISLSRCSKCKFVFYCSRKCQKLHWTMHKSECFLIAGSAATPGPTLRIILYLITSKMYQSDPVFATFLSHNEKMLGNYGDKVRMQEFYTMLMVLSRKQVSISEEEFFQIFGKVQINAFDLSDPEGNEIGVALYRRSAKFDHSCLPNAIVTFIGKEIRIIASEDVPDASKIRISYLNLLIPTNIRQKSLQNRYFFQCNCSRCCNVEDDFRISIPLCCGNPLRHLISDDFINQSIATLPTEAFVLLSNLSMPLVIRPKRLYICDQCQSVYNAAVFEAFEGRCYEISSFSDALDLYKACIPAATKRENGNKYFCLFYEHEESLPFFCLCRTLVMTYKVDEKAFIDYSFNYEELDLVLEAGLRLNRCLCNSSFYQSFRSHFCNVISSFLAILSVAIIFMKEYSPTDRVIDVNSRVERCIGAFVVVARSAIPLCEKFAPHFPNLAELLVMLKQLVVDWNLKI